VAGEIEQFDADAALAKLDLASQTGKLSRGAVPNIRRWLTEPRYARYAPQVAEHLSAGKWKELDDAFWTVIPFGTGGRRGRMYPIGSNTINDRTIGESAQGVAQYVREVHGDDELSCAIAYDTRHRSRHFAELCAGIMAAAGLKVYMLDDYRSTPELSFLVRYRDCSCGIMVTASHNPPSDNAVKVYWSSGGQLVPPHDKSVIERVMNVDRIEQMDFDEAVAGGRIVLCKEEVDAAFQTEVRAQSFAGPRELKILYSPLHGVGESAVCPVLKADGFDNVEVFTDHREPSGDFPNVPGHVSNPENAAVFTAIIQHAQATGAELILATDPDCDRVGCAAPLSADPSSAWATFTGNQIGALLADYVLEQRKMAGTLSPRHYLIKTLVTTELIRRIGDSYGVKTYGDLLVGFKWIGQLLDQKGPDEFVLGAEESHGYLVGQYVRDKDASVACMLLAELAACIKAQGKTLHEKLDALFWQHGYHAEKLVNVQMEGSEGMTLMQSLMTRFRQQPPQTLAGIPVAGVRDYLNQVNRRSDGTSPPITEPVERENMLIFDLVEPGNYVAVRPSGTEPKIKYYMFTFVPAEQLADLELAKQEMADRLKKFESDLRAF
jgi:phosphoglucomutase/phosphomannomutase